MPNDFGKLGSEISFSAFLSSVLWVLVLRTDESMLWFRFSHFKFIVSSWLASHWFLFFFFFSLSLVLTTDRSFSRTIQILEANGRQPNTWSKWQIPDRNFHRWVRAMRIKNSDFFLVYRFSLESMQVQVDDAIEYNTNSSRWFRRISMCQQKWNQYDDKNVLRLR